MPPKSQRLRLERGKTLMLPMLNLKRPTVERQATSLNGTETKKMSTSMFHQDEDHFTYVGAIEIGTSYSGYAYSPRKEGKTISKDIVMNPVWLNTEKTLQTLRTPSCLLLNEKKEFEAYGYEAEKMYNELMKESKDKRWYYFRRFKPKLLNIKDLKANTTLNDESGKHMPALKVFSLAIRFLKSQLLNDLSMRGKDAEVEDIRWVITVPGFASDHAKQFMRKAALMAGLPELKLKLCLEPEAASLFCQNMPSNMVSDKLPIFKAGTKYCLADLGGGLTDIVMHEKRRDAMREVSRGTGAKLGGGAVDNIFVQFLFKLLGDKIAEDFVNSYTKDFLTMMREFEIQKRKVTPMTNCSIELKVPACVQMLCQKQQYNDTLANVVYRSVYQGRVKYHNQKLKIDAVVSNEFFRAITLEMAKLINHSLTTLKTAKDITILVLTGGFAENEVVQEIMHQELVGKTQIKQIIVPPDADVAVLKGAVVFGNNPAGIGCRINRTTIGLRIAKLYNPEMHEPKRKSVLHGVEYVLDVFSPFLSIGTRVPVGFISHQALTTTEPNQKKIVIDVYQSVELSHNYVTEDGVENLGKLEYTIPIPSEEARTVYVDFILGETELMLKVVDKKTSFISNFHFPMLKEK